MNEVLTNYSTSLIKIWDEIGLSNEQRRRRVETLVVIAENFMSRAVNEDDNKKNKLISNIESCGAKVFELNKELGLHSVEVNMI